MSSSFFSGLISSSRRKSAIIWTAPVIEIIGNTVTINNNTTITLENQLRPSAPTIISLGDGEVTIV